MAKKKKRRRRRTFSEKALMVLGIFIVISMVLAAVANVISPG